MRRGWRSDEVWEAVIIAAAVAIAWWIFVGSSAKAAELEPFLGYTHTSDFTTGPPLFANAEGCEPTTDWFGAGVTIVWPRFELDVAHGVKARDAWCGKAKLEQGTELSFRWYPRRKH